MLILLLALAFDPTVFDRHISTKQYDQAIAYTNGFSKAPREEYFHAYGAKCYALSLANRMKEAEEVCADGTIAKIALGDKIVECMWREEICEATPMLIQVHMGWAAYAYRIGKFDVAQFYAEIAARHDPKAKPLLAAIQSRGIIGEPTPAQAEAQVQVEVTRRRWFTYVISALSVSLLGFVGYRYRCQLAGALTAIDYRYPNAAYRYAAYCNGVFWTLIAVPVLILALIPTWTVLMDFSMWGIKNAIVNAKNFAFTFPDWGRPWFVLLLLSGTGCVGLKIYGRYTLPAPMRPTIRVFHTGVRIILIGVLIAVLGTVAAVLWSMLTKLWIL